MPGQPALERGPSARRQRQHNQHPGRPPPIGTTNPPAPARVYVTALLMVTGFAFSSRLAQTAPPHMRFVSLGAELRLGLPSRPASQRRSFGGSALPAPARSQTKPPACYRASWQLPGPDSHRQATTSLRTRRPTVAHVTVSPPIPLGARNIRARRGQQRVTDARARPDFIPGGVLSHR